MPHIVCHVLINQNNPNIIPGRERFECTFNSFWFRVGFNNEKVCRFGGAVTNTCQKETCDGVLLIVIYGNLKTLARLLLCPFSLPETTFCLT